MIKLVIFLLLLTTSSLFAETKENDLTLSIDGVFKKKYSLEELKHLKSSNVEFYDHLLRKSDFFKGVVFSRLLEDSNAFDLNKIIEIELISKNGYKSYFSTDMFLKTEAILAYEAVGGSKFERFSQKDKKIVSLGPYYLVWDFKTLTHDQDRMQYNSVYQINKINFITNTVDFGIQKDTSDDKINLGYRTYKKYCLSCHAIGTWGGEIGSDLIKKKVIELKGSQFLIKYALDPKSQNPQTNMLPLPKYKNSEAMAESIVDFLKFVQNADHFLNETKIKKDKARYGALKSILEDVSGNKKE